MYPELANVLLTGFVNNKDAFEHIGFILTPFYGIFSQILAKGLFFLIIVGIIQFRSLTKRCCSLQVSFYFSEMKLTVHHKTPLESNSGVFFVTFSRTA